MPMPAGEIASLLCGIGIGVAVAAPVGPMSVLCMRRTLTGGYAFGLGTGIGIAAGDASYALVAALGLSGVMRFMLAHERPLHALAGAFLLYLGWRAFTTPADAASTAAPVPISAVAAFGSAFALTLTNPPTIVSFVAIFTAFAPAGFTAAQGAAMVAGVFAGSLLWWALVVALVSRGRRALGPQARRWIDWLSGLALGALGAVELRRAL